MKVDQNFTMQKACDHAKIMGRQSVTVLENQYKNIEEICYYGSPTINPDEYTVAIWRVKSKLIDNTQNPES